MHIVTSEVNGISDFIVDKNLIGIAVAIILSIQLTELSTSFVDDILSPVILLLFGADKTQSMKDLYVDVYQVRIYYGKFLVALFKFLLLLIILYNVIALLAKYQLVNPASVDATSTLSYKKIA